MHRPQDFVGRAAGPSLFIFAAAIALLVAALLSGNIYRWCAICLLAAALLLARRRAVAANALSVTVLLLSAWFLLSAAFLSPYYAAESIYRPMILLFSFGAFATLDEAVSRGLFVAGAVVMALLVLLGFAQLLFGFWHLAQNAQRAAAAFITPNTFATAINLFLLPLLALLISGKGGRWGFALAMWLFAGLLSTESRGGYLGFVGGAAFVSIQAARGIRRFDLIAVLRVASGLCIVAILFILAVLLLRPSAGAPHFGATLIERGLNFRVELATATARHLLEHPLIGAGANMFRPLYEMTRPADFANTHVYLYSHNDFLQVWLEYGAIGILLLCGFVLVSLRASAAAREDGASGAARLACGAALAGVFAHALVDFPLYVPFILLIVGAYTGVLASWRGDSAGIAALAGRVARGVGTMGPRVRAVAIAAILFWTGLPVFADFAESRALSNLFSGRLEAGMKWQELARHLEPRNSQHYWAEAVIWREHAVESGDRAAAARADELFSAGIAANPYEIANYLDRARLHRERPQLLERVATHAELVGWTAEAARLRPNSLLAQAEHARVLAHVGRGDDARRIVRRMLQSRPDAAVVKSVAAELL